MEYEVFKSMINLRTNIWKIILLCILIVFIPSCYTLGKILFAGSFTFGIRNWVKYGYNFRSDFCLDDNNNVFFPLTIGEKTFIGKLDLETEKVTQITNGGNDCQPFFDEFNNRLFFYSRNIVRQQDITVMDLTTGETEVLFRNEAIAFGEMLYNPNDSLIYLLGTSSYIESKDWYKSHDDMWDIFSLNPKTREFKRLTKELLDVLNAPVLDTDSNKIYLYITDNEKSVKTSSEYLDSLYSLKDYRLEDGLYWYNISDNSFEKTRFDKDDSVKYRWDVFPTFHTSGYISKNELMLGKDWFFLSICDFDKMKVVKMVEDIGIDMTNPIRMNDSKNYIGITKFKGKYVFGIFDLEELKWIKKVPFDPENFIPLDVDNNPLDEL
jgi:hypothetical protein